MKNAFSVFSLIWLLSGCQLLKSADLVVPVLQSEFQANSDKGSTLYISEAELARDFMPVLSSGNESIDGRPLMGTIIIRRMDRLNISESLKVTKVVVRNGDQVWIAKNITAEIYKPEPDYLTVSFDNGPKWEPSSFADINLEYVDSDCKSYTIVISKIKIDRLI